MTASKHREHITACCEIAGVTPEFLQHARAHHEGARVVLRGPEGGVVFETTERHFVKKLKRDGVRGYAAHLLVVAIRQRAHQIVKKRAAAWKARQEGEA